jgi:hypothetical protein
MPVAFRVPDDGGELRQRLSSKDMGAERATMVRLAKWCTMPAPPSSKLSVSSAWRARVSLVIAPPPLARWSRGRAVPFEAWTSTLGSRSG